MEPEIMQTMLRRNQWVLRRTNQFYMDFDVNVPDAKPDVGKVILSVGQLQIGVVKATGNQLQLGGTLRYQLLYGVESEPQEISSLRDSQAFEESIYVEKECKGKAFASVLRTEVSTSMIHSRKLHVKVWMDVEVSYEEEQELFLTCDINASHLQKKTKEYTFLTLHSMKKDVYRVKEEMELPGTKENIGTLLWWEVLPRKLDTRISNERLLLQGELQVFCLYESVDGKKDWVEQAISYEGSVECEGAEEGMFYQAKADFSDAQIEVRLDSDGEPRVFGLEMTVGLWIHVFREEPICFLEDVYACHKKCLLEKETVFMESLLMQNHSKIKLVERLSLPELRDDILQICYYNGCMQMEHVETVKQGVSVEGVFHLYFMYVKENDSCPFGVWQGMVPFSQIVESQKTSEKMTWEMTAHLEQMSLSLQGNKEVEVKAVLSLQVLLKEPVYVENISQIRMEEYEEEEISAMPSLVGYFVREGDCLWDLAKKYQTTVSSIVEKNELREQELKQGQKLLLFREKMDIL